MYSDDIDFESQFEFDSKNVDDDLIHDILNKIIECRDFKVVKRNLSNLQIPLESERGKDILRAAEKLRIYSICKKIKFYWDSSKKFRGFL